MPITVNELLLLESDVHPIGVQIIAGSYSYRRWL